MVAPAVEKTPDDKPARVFEKPKPLPPVGDSLSARIESEPGATPSHAAARTSSGHPQDIWVTSNPPGAKATIDGNFVDACTTPCMLHGAPGVHHLAISQAGYSVEYRDVRVGDTAVDVPQVTLQQPQGTLFLTTTPAGASISVNGRPIPQLTPAAITLPPGSYSIVVEKMVSSKTKCVQLRDGLVRLSIPLNQ